MNQAHRPSERPTAEPREKAPHEKTHEPSHDLKAAAQNNHTAKPHPEQEVVAVRIADPDPDDISEALWPLLIRVSTVGMFFVVAIAALYFARSIVMPVVAALIVGITLSPIQKRASDFKIPPVLTALLLVALFLGAVYVASLLIVGPATEFITQARAPGESLKEKLHWLDRPLGAVRNLKQALGESTGDKVPVVKLDTSLAGMVAPVLGILTPAVTELLVFLGTLLFFLVSIDRLRRQLVTFFSSRDGRLRALRIWNDIEHNLITYLATVSVINFGLGIATALMLFAIGFPNAPAFGVLAFMLNYAPYIGPAVLVLTLFAVGVVTTPTLGSALLAPALFVTIATIEGQFITPSVIGHRLTLSPLLVFLALAFWSWLWGPFGTLMATPLLIVALVVLIHAFPHEDKALP